MRVEGEARSAQTGGRLFGLCLGHSLAYYDFIIFSVMAVQISQAIFPGGDPTTALMKTFGLMGVAYVARPLGALVLGRLADRAGRRKALLLSFTLAGVAVTGQALVPPHAEIGLAAPALMLAFRLLLGFAVGGEFGTSTAMLVESAPAGRRGSFVSLQLAGQDVGGLLAGFTAMLLAIGLTASQLGEWGWRLALLLGGSIVPLGLYLRSRLVETLPSGGASGRETALTPTRRPQILVVLLLLTALFVADGIKYLAIYAQTVLSLEPRIAFSATIAISVAAILFSVTGGLLSDRIGRKPLMLMGMVAVTLAVLPAFWWLNASPTLGTLVIVSGLLASTLSFGSAAIITTLAEVMPAQGRATALALVAAGGVALINGTGDLFNTWLIRATEAPLAPAVAMTFAGLFGISAALALPETRPKQQEEEGFSPAGTARA